VHVPQWIRLVYLQRGPGIGEFHELLSQPGMNVKQIGYEASLIRRLCSPLKSSEQSTRLTRLEAS
jgi:hypothetical protein